MKMNKYVFLAKKAVENFIRKRIKIGIKETDSSFSKRRAGVFVSIKDKNGLLRGCIGTIKPFYENVAQEIIENAIAAATQDPRFSEIKENELENLEYQVYILGKLKKTDNLKKLNHLKDGIYVQTKDGRSGVLLPGIEGINSVEEQIIIACQKAGIDPFQEEFEIFSFKARKYENRST